MRILPKIYLSTTMVYDRGNGEETENFRRSTNSIRS